MPQPFNNAVVTDAGTELLIKAQFGEAAAGVPILLVLILPI